MSNLITNMMSSSYIQVSVDFVNEGLNAASTKLNQYCAAAPSMSDCMTTVASYTGLGKQFVLDATNAVVKTVADKTDQLSNAIKDMSFPVIEDHELDLFKKGAMITTGAIAILTAGKLTWSAVSSVVRNRAEQAFFQKYVSPIAKATGNTDIDKVTKQLKGSDGVFIWMQNKATGRVALYKLNVTSSLLGKKIVVRDIPTIMTKHVLHMVVIPWHKYECGSNLQALFDEKSSAKFLIRSNYNSLFVALYNASRSIIELANNFLKSAQQVKLK